MNDIRHLARLGQQLSPLAAQMARRLVLSAPLVSLEVRIAIDQVLRERGKGSPEITPAEALALIEPKKHGIPRERLVAHLEASNFICACISCKGAET